MKEKLKKLVDQFQFSCKYDIECKVKDDIGNHGYELIFRRVEQCFKEAAKVLGRN